MSSIITSWGKDFTHTTFINRNVPRQKRAESDHSVLREKAIKACYAASLTLASTQARLKVAESSLDDLKYLQGELRCKIKIITRQLGAQRFKLRNSPSLGRPDLIETLVAERQALKDSMRSLSIRLRRSTTELARATLLFVRSKHRVEMARRTMARF